LIMSLGRLINDPVGFSLQILCLLLQFLVEVVEVLSLYTEAVDLFTQCPVCLQQLAKLVVCLPHGNNTFTLLATKNNSHRA